MCVTRFNIHDRDPRFALGTLAAPCADLLVNRSPRGCVDRDDIVNAASRLDWDPVRIDKHWRAALDILTQAPIWHAVMIVAARLLREGTLRGGDVVEIVKNAPREPVQWLAAAKERVLGPGLTRNRYDAALRWALLREGASTTVQIHEWPPVAAE